MAKNISKLRVLVMGLLAVGGLGLSSCATADKDTSGVCAEAQRKAASGETLSADEQSCVNREISSEKPASGDDNAAPSENIGRPGTAIGPGRAY